MTRTSLLMLAGLGLAACETPTTQRYAIAPDNVVAIRALNTSGVGVGPFTPPATFDVNCRLLGPLRVADGLTHTQYIQRAFEDELKVAGAFAAGGPRIQLSGQVNTLVFSSMRGLVGGRWTIGITLVSSNGRTMTIEEAYEFESGFAANEACRQTADAFLRAVQNLVGRTVRDPAFRDLIT